MFASMPCAYQGFPKPADSFKRSIMDFVSSLESEPKQAYNVTHICSKFGFQRRRFYDVMNVLEAIGCCQKVSVDSLMWLGRSNVQMTLTKLAVNAGSYEINKSLDDIIPSESCISISRLTQLFALIFISLKSQQVDIKQSAAFLSKDNGRHKTTLCKLYQIAHILESAGIIDRAINPGEVRIRDCFFVHIPDAIDRTPSILSINTLLSRPTISQSYVDRRNTEFYAISYQHKMPKIPPHILNPITA